MLLKMILVLREPWD